MIIWLASYPKSGNTLIRSMLSAYFFTKDGNFNFKVLSNIKQFPDFGVFKNLGIDISNENEVVKNYINIQKQWPQHPKDVLQIYKKDDKFYFSRNIKQHNHMGADTIKDNKISTKATERISGSEAIVRCLIEEGIKIIYGYKKTYPP